MLLPVFTAVIGTNVEWVRTIGTGLLLGVKRKLAYAPRQRGFSSVPDPLRKWDGLADRRLVAETR